MASKQGQHAEKVQPAVWRQPSPSGQQSEPPLGWQAECRQRQPGVLMSAQPQAPAAAAGDPLWMRLAAAPGGQPAGQLMTNFESNVFS